MGSGASKINPVYPAIDVFLGGSCNPTTWRRNIAIPMLTKANVSFYNPQVINWTPDLVTIEASAKDKAGILLFVIDNQTRAVASIAEAAYYIGMGRKIVLVVMNIVVEVNDIAECEFKDLNRGRTYISDFARRSGVSVFGTIEEGVQECIKLVKKNGV